MINWPIFWRNDCLDLKATLQKLKSIIILEALWKSVECVVVSSSTKWFTKSCYVGSGTMSRPWHVVVHSFGNSKITYLSKIQGFISAAGANKYILLLTTTDIRGGGLLRYLANFSSQEAWYTNHHIRQPQRTSTATTDIL